MLMMCSDVIRTSLQPVDVLCVHAEELTLLVKQTYEVVAKVGSVVSWIEFFGESKEWVRVVMKEVDLKDGLGIWQVILLKVVIEATAWRPDSQYQVSIWSRCKT